MLIGFYSHREKEKRAAAEQQLAAAVAKAAADSARWREEVDLKQVRINMLVAGDRAKEADFMSQRVKELQVTPWCHSLCLHLLLLPSTLCFLGHYCRAWTYGTAVIPVSAVLRS